MKFTLDNNCLVAIDKREPAATHVLMLVEAHRAGRAEVAVLGIGASERQPGGGYLKNIGEFTDWLGTLGLSEVTVNKPTGIWDVTFYDWSEYASPEDIGLERQIHDELFPASDFNWMDVAAASGEALGATHGPGYRRWRNRRCDVQGLLAHIRHGGDVFVTSDERLSRKRASALVALGAKSVVAPATAAGLLPSAS